jgi:hypothetical protein
MTHSNIFPLMMQVASKTIGLDLVSVNPLPGPKMNLMYLDYTYGDTLTQKRIKKIKSIYNKL